MPDENQIPDADAQVLKMLDDYEHFARMWRVKNSGRINDLLSDLEAGLMELFERAKPKTFEYLLLTDLCTAFEELLPLASGSALRKAEAQKMEAIIAFMKLHHD